MEDIKVLAGWIIVTFAFTIPLAILQDEIKVWVKVWLVTIAVIVLSVFGLKLMGVC